MFEALHSIFSTEKINEWKLMHLIVFNKWVAIIKSILTLFLRFLSHRSLHSSLLLTVMLFPPFLSIHRLLPLPWEFQEVGAYLTSRKLDITFETSKTVVGISTISIILFIFIISGLSLFQVSWIELLFYIQNYKTMAASCHWQSQTYHNKLSRMSLILLFQFPDYLGL